MTEASAKHHFPGPGVPNERRLAKAVERANQAFADKNLRFTKLRQGVFEEIASTYTSIGAYDVLARLAEKGTRLAPISVYRAIDALIEAGVIHRLESKNAYFACRKLDHATGRRPIFLACEKCNAVAEVDSEGIFETIDRAAKSASFQPRVKFVEVSGICRHCASKKD
ncbi:MAG TPA: transcriptional repressor [Hyphomicrobiaceae bacterium]|nr:transcriptional repressor [Hyphomicrobiaceae bacterium]